MAKIKNPLTVISTLPDAEAEEKDINFYDCDGTRKYSWTLDELRTATELPPNPSRDRLVAQGWNWTLEELQELDDQMDVGQIYTTEDDKTHLVIDVPRSDYFLYVGFASNGESTIDWGDGETDTVTGTSATEAIFTSHTYAAPGRYVIRLGGNVYLLGDSGGSVLLTLSGAKETENASYSRMSILREINISVTHKAHGYDRPLQNAKQLEILTIPNGTGSTPRVPSCQFYAFPRNAQIGYYLVFGGAKHVCCSKLGGFGEQVAADSIIRYRGFHGTGVSYGLLRNSQRLISARVYGTFTATNSVMFGYCYSLQDYSIPNTVKALGADTFYQCYSLEEIRVPILVTSIGARAFAYCISLKRLIFAPDTPPVVANANAFSGINPSCKILVPRGSLTAYTQATNYPSAETITYEEYDV